MNNKSLSILIVFRGVPYVIGLIIIFFTLLLVDRKALKWVDYGFLIILTGAMLLIKVI